MLQTGRRIPPDGVGLGDVFNLDGEIGHEDKEFRLKAVGLLGLRQSQEERGMKPDT
jgi:hypothetical protein